MRYFISFLIALGLLIFVIFLLFHSTNKPKQPQLPLTVQTLADYANSDAETVMTIDGPVNNVQEHWQVRVTVGRDNVTFEQLQGYSGNVTNMQNFANTQDAYAAFLKSLAHAGFTNGNKDPKSSDERGFCPIGERYVFQLRENGQDLERYWATSCGNPKTYLGAFSLTVELFTAQVPNYGILTENLKT